MIEFRTLGTIDLRDEHGTEVRSVLRGPKQLAVLALLALRTPRGFHRRDKIVGLMWPDRDQGRARHALRNTLHSLRAALGNDILTNRGDEEVGLREDAFWCDAVAFDAEAASGEPDAAVARYAGELLPGFFVADAPEFERWLEKERRRLRLQAVTAAWDAARRAEFDGAIMRAREFAQRAVELDPVDEVGLRRLISLLDRLGDRRGAVHAYRRFARRFADEYGLEPSPETRRLIDDVTSREALVDSDGDRDRRPRTQRHPD